MKGESRAAMRGASHDGVDHLQERGVSVFERHAVEPEGKPADVWPPVEQKPADGHEGAFIGTGVLGELSGEEAPYDDEVDGEQQERVEAREPRGTALAAAGLHALLVAQGCGGRGRARTDWTLYVKRSMLKG